MKFMLNLFVFAAVFIIGILFMAHIAFSTFLGIAVPVIQAVIE